MRKKIIAAAAVQLAAAFFLLLITPLWSWALEKYGTDHTLTATNAYGEGPYFFGEGSERREYFAFSIHCENVPIEGLKHPAREYVATSDEPTYFYMGNGKRSNAVYLHMGYIVKDAALSDKLAALYDDDLTAFDGLGLVDLFNLRQTIERAAYHVNIRMFGSRVKFLSLTVNGQDMEAFLAETLGVAL